MSAPRAVEIGHRPSVLGAAQRRKTAADLVYVEGGELFDHASPAYRRARLPIARRCPGLVWVNYQDSGTQTYAQLVTLADYLPIGIMLVLAAVFVAVSLVASRLFRPNRPTFEKLEPYECGIIPEVEPSQRFPVKFYLVAMLFVIFDVEIIFLFAWASIWTDLGWYGIAAVLIFTFFVLETLAYVWKRGALDWNVKRRARYIPPETQRAA